MSLSNNVKAFRVQRGFSQEKLAELTGLSLRTIQRVENNETKPMGDTLSRIAEVFQIAPDELIQMHKPQDSSYLIVLNLTQFCSILFPIVGVLVPSLLWILKKNIIDRVDEIGKNIINFQITWSIVLLVGTISYYMYSGNIALENIGEYLTAYQQALLVYQIFLICMILYNNFIIAFNTFKIRSNNNGFYQPAIPFLR